MHPHNSRFLKTALSSAFLLLIGLAAHAQTAGLRLMPLGDSITAGYRSSTGNGYRGPLWNELAKQGDAVDFVGGQRDGDTFDPDSEGHSGYRIDQIAALTDKALSLYQPNVVLLDIGVNDIGQNYQVSTAPARLASLIDQIIADNPTATILVASLICNSTPRVQAQIDTFNSQLPAIVQARASAGKHISLVNMSSLTLADLKDGLHPNDGGYQKMADIWDAAIQKVVAAGGVAHIDFAGRYEIQSVANHQALDNSVPDPKNGTPIVLKPATGSANQMWNFIPTSGGYYQIRNASSGLDLNVTAASKSSGATVVQWPFGTEQNDQWLPVQNPGGTYAFRNRNSGLLLDAPSGAPNTAPLVQSDASSATSQKFKLIQK